MTNLAKRLGEHLYNREPVLEAFRDAHIRLVHSLLSKVLECESINEPNWQQLLSWASVFAQSDKDEHIELAIIGAISALLTAETHTDMARQAAIFILESCSNTPTIKLSEQNGLVNNLKVKLNITDIIGQYQRKLRHFIFDDLEGSLLQVTDFQERIWDSLASKGDAAFSAPTSAGKSFVLIRWLVQNICHSVPGTIIAYIVPSRALITQVKHNVEERLIKYKITPRIVTLPSLYVQKSNRNTILIMTQERIERLLAINSNIYFQTLIIDEAHKLGEGPRGVILQRIVDESLGRFDGCRVIIAAPHANNADVLLPRLTYPGETIIAYSTIADSRPTVLQNLYWLTPVLQRRARWCVSLVRDIKVGTIGEFTLDGSPAGKTKQLAAIAYRLGKYEKGNIVFTNGPAEAEKIALLLSGHIEHSIKLEIEGNINQHAQEINDLVKLVKDTIHPSYPLAQTLPFGVGIHYGDMPEISRREQERLFDEGKLSFLVCTSTLLEGVNLPCKNLFIWGPRQGKGNPMSEHAFWNLAGRAGRWGREFAGNIFCIDVDKLDQWPNGPPTKRRAQKVEHSGSKLLKELALFQKFVSSTDPIIASRGNRYFEQILGELIGAHLDGLAVSSIGWARWATTEQLVVLDNVISSVMSIIKAPPELIRRHRGINPMLIDNFFQHLTSQSSNQAENFMPMSPAMPHALSVLSKNLRLSDEYLGSNFGSERARNLIAKITIDWIRGLPLGRIISQRINYLRSMSNDIKIPAEIRSVIGLINENARFLIPKYLSCYSDCVAYWFALIGRDDLANEVGDIQDMLETGVTDKTMIALVGLGLSRTSAIEIATHIPNTELSIDGVISWLRGRNLEAYGISPVIIREVNKALTSIDFL